MTLPILWLGQEVQAATRATGQTGWSAQRIIRELSEARPGDLWLASRFSHEHWPIARQRGVSAIIAEQPASSALNTPLLHVPSVKAALADLASTARLRSAASCVLLLGGCAHGVRDILLAGLGRRHSFQAPDQLQTTTDLELAVSQLPRSASTALFCLQPLTRCNGADAAALIRPSLLIVAPGPLDNPEQLHKLVMAALLHQGPHSIVLLPADHPHLAAWQGQARASGVRHCFSFGQHQGADCQLTQLGPRQLQLASWAGQLLISSKGLNPWQATVLPASWLAAHVLGADLTSINQKLQQPVSDFTPLPVAATGHYRLLDATAMATPAGLLNSLQQAKNLACTGRKYLVLGDLGLLDPGAVRFYAELAGPVAAAGMAKVFSCGFMTKALQEALPTALRGTHQRTPAALVPYLSSLLQPDDLLLVSGAKTMHMEELLAALPTAASLSPISEFAHAI